MLNVAARSAWSRSGRILEIPDVSETEALDYLKSRNLDGKQASQLYELVGGRVVQLESAVNDMKQNMTVKGMVHYVSKTKVLVSHYFIDIERKMFASIFGQLGSAEMLPNRRYHNKEQRSYLSFCKRDPFLKLITLL